MIAYRMKMLARRAQRQGISFWITVIGLIIGLTAAAFIAVHVARETSYDRTFADFRHIYRAEMVFESEGRPPRESAMAPGPLRNALVVDFPEIVSAARIFSREETVRRGGDPFTETISYVDPEFFRIFRLPASRGDLRRALANPNSIVLSERAASKFFGGADPIGKVLTLRGNTDYVVSGVIRGPPTNTHLREALDFLVLFDEAQWPYQPESYTSWRGATAYTYVRLRDGVEPEQLAPRFPSFLDRNVTVPPSSPFHGRRGSEHMAMSFVPIADIRLNSESEYQLNDLETGTYGRVLMLVLACFIVIGASAINFAILAIASAYERAREISLHIVHGARRSQILMGFAFESIVVVGFCSLVSILLLYVVLWIWGEDWRQILVLEGGPGRLLLVVAPLVALVMVLSSFVPAAHISSLKPARFLHSGHAMKGSAKWLLWVLLPLQAAIAISLSVAAWTLFAQYRYSMHPDTSLNMENVAVIRLPRAEPADRLAPIAERLRSMPDIPSVGRGEFVPGDDRISSTVIRTPRSEGLIELSVNKLVVGPGYFEALQVRPIAGRLLSESRPVDTLTEPAGSASRAPVSVLVNARLARELGYAPHRALGVTLDQITELGGRSAVIVGVLPDIKWTGVRQEVVPTLFYFDPKQAVTLLVNYGALEDSAAFASLERVWRTQFPELPFDAVGLADHWAAQHWDQERSLYIFTGFAGLAIGLAAIGLYASALYSVQQSRREIAIRKVFGAAPRHIAMLLLWRFTPSVAAAGIIGTAAAAWLLHRWLLGFQYRIELGPLPFLAAGAAALVLTWLIVLGQALKSSRISPAVTLREE